MEDRLAKYRAEKVKTNEKDSLQSSLRSVFTTWTSLLRPSESRSASQVDQSNNIEDIPPHIAKIKLILKILLWLILFALCLEYGLAGPYCLITVFYLLYYFGTSSGKVRDKTELSAYSVFNPNCVRLEGTFTAEQFENELLRRPLTSKTSES